MRDTSLTIRTEPSLKKAAEQSAAASDETLPQVLSRALQQLYPGKGCAARHVSGGFIHLLVSDNPKRPGTAAHQAWALYTEGMFTADYDAELSTIKERKLTGAACLAWDVSRGLIQISDYCGIILTAYSPEARKSRWPIFRARRPWLVVSSGAARAQHECADDPSDSLIPERVKQSQK
jgi:hypothetical protein